jgi:hypothetical protein
LGEHQKPWQHVAVNRERKYGLTLTVVGGLTLPFFIGIPLLASGIILLASGGNIRTERWIRVLFSLVVAALALGLALAIAFPVGGHSAETDIGRSVLCFAPVFLAVLFSVAMAALTAARFPSLSLKYRTLGLGFGVLCVSGICIALVLSFPWQALGLAGLVATIVWARMAWRQRTRRRRAAGLRNLPAEVIAPEMPVPAHELPAPVAELPQPPRVRRPLCGILAWVLPLLAMPVGVLLAYLADRFGKYEGFQGWAVLGWLFIPLMLAVPASFILAIVSLCRRERCPSVAISVLVLVAIGLLFVAPLVLLSAGILLSAGWLVWRHRKRLKQLCRRT